MHRSLSTKLVLLMVCCLAPLATRADVVKVVVDDTIHPMVAEHIGRAIQEANRTHADALLIELRTPGGLMDSMREIVQEILASPVPVIVYVTPAGSNAASAGFFVLESADIAAMAPGTNTGAAHPIRGDGVTMDPVLKEKIENDAAALMRSFAPKRGRNLDVAESAVRQSKSFSADEALAKHLVDYIAKDEDDLFQQLDGKTLTRFDGSKTVLHTSGKAVRFYPMTVRQDVLSWLMNPNLTFLLFSIGMLALYAEFNHPGAVVPGVVGAVFIFLSLFAFHLLPTSYGALAMILGAFLLFAIEVKYHTHGVAGGSGIVVMILGALLLVDGPVPQMRIQWQTATASSISLGLITIFLMSIALKARRNKVVTGEQGLLGEVGVASSPLTPSGQVFVHGELWNAVATGNLDAGRPVVVRGVKDLVLQVEPAPEATSGGVRNT